MVIVAIAYFLVLPSFMIMFMVMSAVSCFAYVKKIIYIIVLYLASIISIISVIYVESFKYHFCVWLNLFGL